MIQQALFGRETNVGEVSWTSEKKNKKKKQKEKTHPQSLNQGVLERTKESKGIGSIECARG